MFASSRVTTAEGGYSTPFYRSAAGADLRQREKNKELLGQSGAHGTVIGEAEDEIEISRGIILMKYVIPKCIMTKALSP